MTPGLFGCNWSSVYLSWCLEARLVTLLSCWSHSTELTISPQILGSPPAIRWSVQFRLSLLDFPEDRSHACPLVQSVSSRWPSAKDRAHAQRVSAPDIETLRSWQLRWKGLLFLLSPPSSQTEDLLSDLADLNRGGDFDRP